jgi:transcriptional regulator with PAS, ATPase and Fis domain
MSTPTGDGRPLARNFRWQAFFEHAADPVFLLDRRGRLLFVNRAWEEITGLSRDEAHHLVCSRPAPAAADDAPLDILAHALTPPRDVLQGGLGRARRLLPGRTDPGGKPPSRPPGHRWWDVEFLPLRQSGRQQGFLILGRITPVAMEELGGVGPLPERLEALRLPGREDAWWLSEIPAMKRALGQARLASRVGTPALLIGEPGVGKRTLARHIHTLGPRREASFAALDCARLPAEAVALLLFGGPGALQREALGTVYLADVDRLPRDLQLRLHEKVVSLLDGEEDADGPPCPRLLAGCTVPLSEAVRAGFLEELACSLGTLTVEVPPLRERKEELRALAEHFLRRTHSAGGLTPAAWEALATYTWPGNLRELFEVLAGADRRRRSAGEPGSIDVEHLPLAVRVAGVPARAEEKALNLPQILQDVERRLIELAMSRAGPNKQKVAALLSMSRGTLLRRLKALGLSQKDEGGGDAAGSGAHP